MPCLAVEASVLDAARRLAETPSVCETILVLADGGTALAPPPGVRIARAPLGRASQMNAGARLARGERLLFLHGDSRILPGDVETWCDVAARNPNAAVAGRLTFRSCRPVYRVFERLAWVRDRIAPLPLGDQGLLLPRDLFERLGGFADEPLFEDVALTLALRRRRALVVSDVPVATSADRFERRGPIRCLLENALLLGGYRLGLSPRRLARHYYGAPYLTRWLEADPTRCGATPSTRRRVDAAVPEDAR